MKIGRMLGKKSRVFKKNVKKLLLCKQNLFFFWPHDEINSLVILFQNKYKWKEKIKVQCCIVVVTKEGTCLHIYSCCLGLGAKLGANSLKYSNHLTKFCWVSTSITIAPELFSIVQMWSSGLSSPKWMCVHNA